MQPKAIGPCRALFPRWFYDQQTGQCEEFTYGGCKGNKNNFRTKEDCERTCGNGLKPPPTKCRKNEQYYDCVPNCRHTCDTYFTNMPCPRFCKSGCYCKEGMVKNRKGKCVKPANCPSNPPATATPIPTNSVCLLPKKIGPCRSSVPRFFYNMQTNQCEQFYYGGCGGNGNNFETKEECERTCENGPTTPSPSKCGKDEEYYGCVPNCHNTCDTYNKKGACPLYCMSGCFCKKGMVKNKDGKCVKTSECPSSNKGGKCVKTSECPSSNPPPTDAPEKCGLNEEYYKDCAPSCTGTCRAYNNPGRYHCPRCRPGCWCKKGLVKNDDGQCVPTDQCGAPPPTGSPPPNPICEQPKKVGPCKARMRRFFYNQETRQCEQFYFGGCQGNENNFKTQKECESKCGSTTPTPICKPDEQYYECYFNCHKTCSTYNKTGIGCAQVCGPGCFCKEGLIRNDDGACVLPSQCNALQPTAVPEQCGENEEYYNDCAPKCMGTCRAYNNPGIYNCPLCRPGCWCKQGLVKNDDGQCVPTDQCGSPPSTEVTTTPAPIPDSCGEDEEYLSCGSACPTTCSTLKRTNFACIALCVPGCFCKEGLVRNDQGECVEPEECPQDTCGEDEEYKDCGSACPPSCSNLGKDQICTQQCVPGCFCTDGLVRNNDGECVEPEDCPEQQTCNEDEEYKECGSSCPPTCSTMGQTQICTQECVSGCFCKEGLVKNDQGECVEPEDCPADKNPQTCGEDEEYLDCGTACPLTCSNIGKDQVCTEQCVSGCFCRKGLVRNEDGECVEPEECPQRTPEECGENEKFYDCAPSCGGTCDTYNKTATILCLPCGPGCWCNEGLVKNSEGKCIPPEQCPLIPTGPNKLCGVNEIYYDECAPSCRGRCDSHNQEHIECPECIPGCWCKEGYLKNQYGKCVRERKCHIKRKIPDCPIGQQYYDCIPSCKRTCMTYNSTSAFCPKECIRGCFCKEGLVMNKNGECVPPEKCPITCPLNQKYYECMPDCKNRCNPPDACAAVCKSGCFCKEGLVMREDGKCVRENLCKEKNPGKPKCERDQEYYDCYQRCRNSCATRNGVCPAVCESGCFCKKGLLLDSQGKCVKPNKCDVCSGVNEEMVPCAMPKSCNTCHTHGTCKLKRCEKGCDCKRGYYRDDKGVCIPQEQCPGTSPPTGECTGENEEMVPCAKPKWCNTCGIKGNCKLKECGKGCDCKSGYYRDDSGVCIPQDKCPDSRPVRCSKPKCRDGCILDHSTKPCPSCSCTGAPSIQCSIPKCDEHDGCSIDHSTKPCPSCVCTGNPTFQCSIPKCDEDNGCSIDHSTKPCPSCVCKGSPSIQCSIPKCDENEGCSIDSSTKPCPSCVCTGDSNNSGTISMTGNENDYDESSYFEESSSSTSETEFFDSSSMSQSSSVRKRSINSQSDVESWFSDVSSENEIDSEKYFVDESDTGYSSMSSSDEEFSYSMSSDSETSSSRSSSGSRSWSSSSSSETDRGSEGNELDSTDESIVIEDVSLSDSQSEYSSIISDSENLSSDVSNNYMTSSLKSSSTENSSADVSNNYMTSSLKSSRTENSSADVSNNYMMSSRKPSSGSRTRTSGSSMTDGDLEQNEIDSIDELTVSEDISSFDSESGYTTMTFDSENWSSDMSDNSKRSSSESSSDSRTWSLNTSNNENNPSLDDEAGNSRLSSGSTDWSSVITEDSEKSSSKSQSGSRTRSSKMSTDFDYEEVDEEYEEYYEVDTYEEEDAVYNENKLEQDSGYWTEEEKEENNGDY